MYFNDRSNTNIDKDLKKAKKRKKKTKSKKKKKELDILEIIDKYKIFIISGLLLIIGIVLIFVSNRRPNYHLDLLIRQMYFSSEEVLIMLFVWKAL